MNAKYDLWDNDDKFSEPRTIPGGWDSAALSTSPNHPPVAKPNEPWLGEKFEEPRTIPGGWNVDALR